jgi:hypothetical protein
MSQPTSGYIYCFHAKGTNRYKIGLTRRDPFVRLKEVNGKQSPYPLVMHHFIEVPDTKSAEKYFHTELAEFRVHNEFFEFNDSNAQKVVIFMNEYANQFIYQDKEYIDNGEYTGNNFDIPQWFVVIIVFLFIAFLFKQCSIISNPKYQDCINSAGGNACEKILKN